MNILFTDARNHPVSQFTLRLCRAPSAQSSHRQRVHSSHWALCADGETNHQLSKPTFAPEGRGHGSHMTNVRKPLRTGHVELRTYKLLECTYLAYWMSVRARVIRAVMVVSLSASKGAAMTSPLALSSAFIGCTMQAVPQPKISRSRPSCEACQRTTKLISNPDEEPLNALLYT